MPVDDVLCGGRSERLRANLQRHLLGTPQFVDPSLNLSGSPFTSISCPSTSFCAAVDLAGREVQWGGSSWTSPSQIDSTGNSLSAVGCASASFCVAGDVGGNGFVCNGSTWSTTPIDAANNTLYSVDNVENVLIFNGSLMVVTATGQIGKTQFATLTGGIFKVTQDRTGITKGLTDLNLVESAFPGAPTYGVCKAGKSADQATVAKLSSKTLQLLKVSAHAKFRTTGRYSSATVRGTIWTIADRCDGTLTHVIRDPVLVDDFVRHRTILLHAGQTYLAKAPA